MPLTQATEFAPAKVNLTLHVTGQRADGYHLLDSLVVFCGIGDVLRAVIADSHSLAVTGPFARDVPPGPDNLVLQAAQAFSPDMGVAFILEKHLPPASGIGGGSADAAAAIRAIARLREGSNAGLDDFDRDAVLTLGADVPVCLLSAVTRMRGIGEQLDATGPLPEMHIALVNPRVAVPTPAVFKGLQLRQNPPMPDTLPHWPNAQSMAGWLKTQRNDLELPAMAIAPVIGEVLANLAACPRALLARMSGSGATCFALFGSAIDAKAASDAIGAANPGWWTAAGPVCSGAIDWNTVTKDQQP